MPLLKPLLVQLLLLLLLFIPRQLHAGESCAACIEFDQLNSAIRDNLIAKSAARDQLSRLLPQLREYYLANGGRLYPRAEWRFPLEGSDLRSAGNSGRDYVASGYDFFAGNRHGGHPSFDLFIRDHNQDCLDDRNGQPVKVLSLSGGIVVALAADWQPGSRLRGGRYLWVYDPATGTLLYYAHNRELLVGLGAILKPGDIIATVGRSGLNANKKRSPSHLHLTCLKLHDGYPQPENIFHDLQQIGHSRRQ